MKTSEIRLARYHDKSHFLPGLCKASDVNWSAYGSTAGVRFETGAPPHPDRSWGTPVILSNRFRAINGTFQLVNFNYKDAVLTRGYTAANGRE